MIDGASDTLQAEAAGGELLAPDPSWQQLTLYGPFTKLVGPFFQSEAGLEEGESLRLGFRVQNQHCNPGGVCHGGMLATFLDLSLGYCGKAAQAIVGNAATISMTVDFLSAAQLGGWVESRVRVLRRTARIMFVEALLVGPAGPLVRGSAVFRIPKQDN